MTKPNKPPVLVEMARTKLHAAAHAYHTAKLNADKAFYAGELDKAALEYAAAKLLVEATS